MRPASRPRDVRAGPSVTAHVARAVGCQLWPGFKGLRHSRHFECPCAHDTSSDWAPRRRFLKSGCASEGTGSTLTQRRTAGAPARTDGAAAVFQEHMTQVAGVQCPWFLGLGQGSKRVSAVRDLPLPAVDCPVRSRIRSLNQSLSEAELRDQAMTGCSLSPERLLMVAPAARMPEFLAPDPGYPIFYRASTDQQLLMGRFR